MSPRDLASRPPVHAGALAAEHARGFSSLALLAGSEPRARILYLLDWAGAALAIRTGDEPRSSRVDLGGWERLPLMTATVDAVVADLDVVPEIDRVRRSVAVELRRVLAPHGRCLLVVNHRRRPRDRREWSRYRLVPPMVPWRRALLAAGFARQSLAMLRFDGIRLAEVGYDADAPRPDAPRTDGDAVALIMSGDPPPSPSVIEAVWRALGRLGVRDHFMRIHVRKIGKAAAFVSSSHGPLVIRLPCSPIAIGRAERNHAAIQALHDAPVPGISQEVVPRPVDASSAAGQRFFAETRVPGVPRRARVRQLTWEPASVEFITNLHAATARVLSLTETWFVESLEPLFSTVERSLDQTRDRAVLDWMRRVVLDRLIGRQLPLVRSHGDFTAGNCLYDSTGRLSGVVDWELSSAGALPLLDLLQAADIEAEYGRDGRWLRADLFLDAIQPGAPLLRAPEIRMYATRLSVENDMLVPLVLLHWLDHVAPRIAARGADERWFMGRVAAPLERWRRIAESGGLPPATAG